MSKLKPLAIAEFLAGLSGCLHQIFVLLSDLKYAKQVNLTTKSQLHDLTHAYIHVYVGN